MGDPTEGRADSALVSHTVLDRKAGKGDQRMTVEVVCEVWSDVMLEDNPRERMRETINRQVGDMADNVGRIVAVDHLKIDVPPLTRFPDGAPCIVTAHLAIAYRIG